MPENQPASQSRKFQLSTHDVEQRKRFVSFEIEDLAHIASIKELIIQGADQFTAVFFDTLSNFDEAATLFKRPEMLEEAKRLKREHLVAMVEGEYGVPYVEQRVRLGMLYSKVGLDIRVFLGAFHHLMRTIGFAIMKRYVSDPMKGFDSFISLKKIGFLDIGVIVDVIVDERERTINLQQEAIRELSTPVLQIRDQLLILPIIGMVDSQRAQQLTDNLLNAICANRAKVVVMDITGVAAVDSQVANHLIQTVTAARLMGATTIITGLSTDIAQSLVALGVDLSEITTVSNLQGGLEAAERLLGYKMVPLDQMANQPEAA